MDHPSDSDSSNMDSDTDSSELVAYLDKINKLVVQIDSEIIAYRSDPNLTDLDYLMILLGNYLDIIETDAKEHPDGTYHVQYLQYHNKYIQYLRMIKLFKEKQPCLINTNSDTANIDFSDTVTNVNLSYQRNATIHENHHRITSDLHKRSSCCQSVTDTLIAHKCQMIVIIVCTIIIIIIILVMAGVIKRTN